MAVCHGMSLLSLATWGRHQLVRLIVAALVIWLLGSLGLYFAERRENPQYQPCSPESIRGPHAITGGRAIECFAQTKFFQNIENNKSVLNRKLL